MLQVGKSIIIQIFRYFNTFTAYFKQSFIFYLIHIKIPRKNVLGIPTKMGITLSLSLKYVTYIGNSILPSLANVLKYNK